GEAVLFARDLGQLRQRVEIDFHVGNTAVGEDYATVSRPRLDADLRQALGARRALRQSFAEAIHVGDELFDGRVLGSDLADLATDRDRHPRWLQVTHRQRQLDRLLVIVPLLFLQGRFGKINQRRRIDIDVVE